MTRFACQRVQLTVERASVRLVLSLYDASWMGAAPGPEKIGPHLVWGRPTEHPHTGVIVDTNTITISERGEYQLVAKVDSDLAGPVSYWDELSQFGLCKNDPASLLDPLSRSARLQVHGMLGLLRVLIRQDRRIIASMSLRVMPHKLDYSADLSLLLQELSSVAASLLLRSKRVATLRSLGQAAPASPLERLLVLQAVLRPSWVPQALAVIAQNPHQEIETTQEILQRHQLHHALPTQLVQTLVSQGSFDKQGRLLPKTFQAQRRQLSFDTPENRFVMSFWSRLRRESKALRASFSRAPEVLPHMVDLSKRVASLPAPLPVELADKEAPKTTSLILRRRRGYRELWMASRLFGRELTPGDDSALEAPGRTLPVLYENWCLLVLARCLASLVGVKPKMPYPLFLQLDGVLRFKTGVMQQIAPGVALGYQVQFLTLRASSLQLRPDFLVELFGKRLVFDAKYRLADDAMSPQHEDMLVAHAYKDALQVDASFVLYPGRGDALIHRQAPPFILPSVGAFPLRPAKPNATGEEALLRFLQECMMQPISARRAAEQRAEYETE